MSILQITISSLPEKGISSIKNKTKQLLKPLFLLVPFLKYITSKDFWLPQTPSFLPTSVLQSASDNFLLI